MQTTLKSPVTFEGIGLHTGRLARMVLRPAFAGHGVWFRRTDLRAGDPMIPARWDSVVPSSLCTRIENAAGASVSTIEHLMAAIAGTGLTNVLVEIDGPEVPILDGSAVPFVRAILGRVGRQAAPIVAIRILRPVEVRLGAAVARLEPMPEGEEGFEIDFEIDFDDRAIGAQALRIDLANGAFARELSDARTFCRQADVARMQACGLALGGTPGVNAVVFDGDRVASPGGLRRPDEPVRHKMLDALGDLALAGAPMLGRYVGRRAGHAMTNALLHALFADPTAWRFVECDAATVARLPGAGLTRADLPRLAA